MHLRLGISPQAVAKIVKNQQINNNLNRKLLKKNAKSKIKHYISTESIKNLG